ncbi:hypothetical protein D6D23_08544 [Aureobasidium pullulans]|nr:hypothetical protein D6D23_08544 [Aureobasidium pullulans]
MAPIPPNPDNNPALARYIAKRQAKAGATVPSSLPSNRTNRPSNRTTQIVNPKNRSCTPSKPTNLEPGSKVSDLEQAPGTNEYFQCLFPPLNRPNDQPPPASYPSKYHYGQEAHEFKIPRPYVKANYVKALMRKDRTHTFRLKALPMKLRDMIYNSALQFDTNGPRRPGDLIYSEMVKPALLQICLQIGAIRFRLLQETLSDPSITSSPRMFLLDKYINHWVPMWQMCRKLAKHGHKRWMEKLDQAKLELRGMTDLYEEYGGDKAAEEILREKGEDPAAWKEIYKAYMEAPRTYLRGPSLTLSRNRSRSRTRRGSTASLTGRVDRMEFTDVTDIKDMSIILSGSTRG